MELLIKLLWVAAGLVGVLVFGGYAPQWWANRDAKDFNKNPGDDTFHDKFHKQRLTWRLGSDGVVALICALPIGLNFTWLAYVPVVLAYFIGMAGYFAGTFNDLLSMARGLPYVGPGYVSQDLNAANPDRWIWKKVVYYFGPSRDIVQHDSSGGSPTVGQLASSLVLEIVETAMMAIAATASLLLLVIAAVIIVMR